MPFKNFNARKRAKGEKMGDIVLFFGGMAALVIAIFICFEEDDFGRAIIIMAGIILIGISFLSIDEKEGMAKEKISSGEYSVVTITKTKRGEQAYLDMLLKRDGEVRYYVFPEDMVVKEKKSAQSSVEVVEKGGLKKIILR